MTTPGEASGAPGGSGSRAILIMFIIGAGVAVLAILGSFLASKGTATDTADLTGTTWTTTSMTVNGSEQPLAAGSTLSLTFADGIVSANAGCNQQNGPGTWTDGRIVLTGPMASTMMACEQTLMNQDQTIAAFLSGNPTYSFEGDVLVITDGSMTLRMTRG